MQQKHIIFAEMVLADLLTDPVNGSTRGCAKGCANGALWRAPCRDGALHARMDLTGPPIAIVSLSLSPALTV